MPKGSIRNIRRANGMVSGEIKPVKGGRNLRFVTKDTGIHKLLGFGTPVVYEVLDDLPKTASGHQSQAYLRKANAKVLSVTGYRK